MKKLLLIFFVVSGLNFLAHVQLFAQHLANDQYTYQLQGNNPAYAGAWNMLGITATGKSQLIGGAFGTSVYDLSIHSPLVNEKNGVGLYLYNYHYGPVNHFDANADYAYKISLGSSESLRLGLRAKFTNYMLSNVQYVGNNNGTDVLGAYDNLNILGLGLGAFYVSSNLYIGLAMPQIKPLSISSDGTILFANVIQFDGGYQFAFNEILDFIPSINARYQSVDDYAVNLNTDFLIYNKIWLGGSWQFGTSSVLGAKLNFKINNQLMVGYALEHFTEGFLSAYRYNNHKLVLSYAIKLNKKRIMSPRFF